MGKKYKIYLHAGELIANFILTMRCPYCNSSDSRVADSRPDIEDAIIRRRRVCNQCGAKFTTVERIQMRDLIKKLSKTKAILMSTHILQEVRSLCSDIYIMSTGNITASGTEEQIQKAAGTKTLEEAFIKLTQSNGE